MKILLSLLLLLTKFAIADDLLFRLDSAIPGSDNALLQFPPSGNGSGGNGKMIQLVYDHDFTANFYVEGAVGYRSPQDIFEYSNMAYEISPGLKVQWGAFIMKLSEGASYMPTNSFDPSTGQGYNSWNFVTHLTFGLRDPKTGLGIYLDRVHYSNGYALDNPALNFTGFMISVPIGKSK